MTDLNVGNFAGLQAQHPEGLFCQMMLQTGGTSTLLVLVADPADEMSTECEVAERILAGVVGLAP